MVATYCPSCKAEVHSSDKFCQKCGNPVSAIPDTPAASVSGSAEKVIRSKGNYSGKMKKGKGRKARKIFFIILIIIALGGTGYLIYWFQTDPKATEKLINVVGGIVIMGILFGIGYLTRRKRGSNDDSNWDSDDTNNNDDRD